jgi:hypothetical protein
MQVDEWNELETSCLDSAREAYSAGSSGILQLAAHKGGINDLEFYRTEDTRDVF